MGGCDKQGFPMKQGVLTPGRVRLLLHRGTYKCRPLFLCELVIYGLYFWLDSYTCIGYDLFTWIQWFNLIDLGFYGVGYVIPHEYLTWSLIILDFYQLFICCSWYDSIFAGTPCFRGYGRRNGERRRKSVRGCIVSPDLSVLNLIIVKKGENDLPGLTDTEKPRMRGPKRASKIRKLFNLSKEDDVRKYVNTYRRTFTTKSGQLSIRFRSLDKHPVSSL